MFIYSKKRWDISEDEACKFYEKKDEIFPEIKLVDLWEKDQMFPKIKVVNLQEKELKNSLRLKLQMYRKKYKKYKIYILKTNYTI